MSDTFITIVLVAVVVLIMFIFPLNFISTQRSTITNKDVEAIANDFVNTVSKEGKITRK